MINAALVSGWKVAVAEIGQRLEHQHEAVLAVQRALLNGMKHAAEHTQPVLAEKLRAEEARHDLIARGQAGLIGALNQHAEALNADLIRSRLSYGN